MSEGGKLVKKVAVLGAGYMGSAITFPLSDNGIIVNLWGTWLDDEIIEASKNGPHPKLKKRLNKNVNLFYSENLKEAIKGADAFFIAVTSEGFARIFELLSDNLDSQDNHYFFKLTKGLIEFEGKIIRATQAAKLIYEKRFGNIKSDDNINTGKHQITEPDSAQDCNTGFEIISVGGPVRALDLSCRIPTASVYGTHSNSKAASIFKSFSTAYYRIYECRDASGVEVCSTFKNIYSIAAGICDGIYKENFNGCYFNIIAFLFNQSLLEMLKIVEITGGQKDTAISFAGTGDLHVTSAAGRNRRFGEMVGKGVNPSEAFGKMLEEGEYGEGYIALKLSVPWLSNYGIDIDTELPLLSALYDIIYSEKNPEKIFNELILKLGT